jgi:hypothetical protein
VVNRIDADMFAFLRDLMRHWNQNNVQAISTLFREDAALSSPFGSDDHRGTGKAAAAHPPHDYLQEYLPRALTAHLKFGGYMISAARMASAIAWPLFCAPSFLVALFIY